MALIMDKENKAVDTTPSAAEEKPEVPTGSIEDNEARFAELEAEKLKAIEEAANYKLAFLKEKSKRKEDFEESDEDEEDKIRRITNETLANSKLAEIAREQDLIIKKALKENKELKLAQLNKTTTPPASMGTHSESTPVKDTIVTSEQMSAFKAKGWSDKDIERYKKNLLRYSGR